MAVVEDTYDFIRGQKTSTYTRAIEEMTIAELLSRNLEWAILSATKKQSKGRCSNRDDEMEPLGMIARALTATDFYAVAHNGIRVPFEEVKRTIINLRREITMLAMLFIKMADKLEESRHSQTISEFWKQNRNSFRDPNSIEIYANRLNYYAPDSMPFMVSKGEIGMVRQMSRPKDELWCLFDCSTVSILRRDQDGHHQYVGDAYMESYNLGELYSDLSKISGVGDKVRDLTIEKIMLH